MGNPIEIDILKLVCRQLEQAEIPYMLTGSFATNFYALPRMTRDNDSTFKIDFIIRKNMLYRNIEFQRR